MHAVGGRLVLDVQDFESTRRGQPPERVPQAPAPAGDGPVDGQVRQRVLRTRGRSLASDDVHVVVGDSQRPGQLAGVISNATLVGRVLASDQSYAHGATPPPG